MRRVFLSAEWRWLAMVQYEVAPEVLAARLPQGVELDLYGGKCLVSLVGFVFDRVRVMGLPVPGHRRFPEVNLRFYVKRTMPDGQVRRGVAFVSEIVPRRAITWVARGIYEEPYRTMPMRWRVMKTAAGIQATYGWQFGPRWQELEVRADAKPRAIEPGSVEEFITEHYFGYTRRRRGKTAEYGVEHPRWRVFPVRWWEVEVDFAGLYGREFAGLRKARPQSVLLAEGSKVKVLAGSKVGNTG